MGSLTIVYLNELNYPLGGQHLFIQDGVYTNSNTEWKQININFLETAGKVYIVCCFIYSVAN